MAKQKSETLFEESSQGAVGAITAVLFVLSAVLLIGGMLLTGFSFQEGMDGVHIWMFSGGIAACVLGFLIPFAFLPASGK